MPQIKVQLNWNQSNFLWNENPFTWNDVFVLIEFLENLQRAPGGLPSLAYKKLDKEKQKKLIKLICQIQNYKPVEYEKELLKDDNYEVILSDIQIVTRRVLGIEVSAIEISD